MIKSKNTHLIACLCLLLLAFSIFNCSIALGAEPDDVEDLEEDTPTDTPTGTPTDTPTGTPPDTSTVPIPTDVAATAPIGTVNTFGKTEVETEEIIKEDKKDDTSPTSTIKDKIASGVKDLKKLATEGIKKAKEAIGLTPSSESSGETSFTPKPDLLCEENKAEFDIEKIDESLVDNLDSKTEETQKTADETLIDQWCASLKDNKDKKALWEKIGKMDEGTKQKFFNTLGSKYNMDLSNLGSTKIASDESGNLLVGDKGIKINFNPEAYYKNENNAFGFKEENYKYSTPKIDKIDVAKDGTVNIAMSTDGKMRSSLSLTGEGVSFDPEKQEIKVGDEAYQWNGQGDMKFNKDTGKVNLNFNKGATPEDITNFPILKMPNGEEVTPFQKAVKGGKPKAGVTAPKSGYSVYEDNGKMYTIDSNNQVYEIKNPEITIDEKGKITEVKDTYINDKTNKFDFFASGNIKIGVTDNAGSIDYSGNKLIIRTSANNEVSLIQSKDFSELDVKGAGTTYIRNGDYLLKFNGDKFFVKPFDKKYQVNGGKFSHQIQSITNAKDAKNPYKIIKKDKGISLTTTKGEILNPLKYINGEIGVPIKVVTPTTTTTTTSANGIIKEGAPTIDGKLRLDINENWKSRLGSIAGVKGANDQDLSSSRFSVDSAGWDGMVTGENKLTEQEFENKLINEVSLDYKIKFISTEVNKETVGQQLGPDLSPLLSQVKTIGAGTTMQFKTSSGKPTIIVNGIPLKLQGKESAVMSYLGTNLKNTQQLKTGSKSGVSYSIIPQTSSGKSLVGTVPMTTLYKSYEYQWNQKHK